MVVVRFKKWVSRHFYSVILPILVVLWWNKQLSGFIELLRDFWRPGYFITYISGTIVCLAMQYSFFVLDCSYITGRSSRSKQLPVLWADVFYCWKKNIPAKHFPQFGPTVLKTYWNYPSLFAYSFLPGQPSSHRVFRCESKDNRTKEIKPSFLSLVSIDHCRQLNNCW